MDNPFMVGDLVHIPRGAVYRTTASDYAIHTTPAPNVGIIINNASADGIYKVYTNGELVYIAKEDMFLLTRKDK